MKNLSLKRAYHVFAVLLVLLLPAGSIWAQKSLIIPAAPPTASALQAGVPRGECFPLETLPADLRPKAEALLLKLLDSEALYTVIGDIKPMSSGYVTLKINTKTPDTVNLVEAHKMLATFRCGVLLTADVLPFHRVQQNERYFEAVVFSKPAFSRMATTYQPFWAFYGITPETPPMDAALLIENDPTTARNRGLGYLYGYPKYAVDFFVAGADEFGDTKKVTPRDFVQLPTFKSATGRFVYAVPKGQKMGPEDDALRHKTERIFSAYSERRARYIGDGKPGVVALLRDWMDDGTGRCAPQNARF